MAIHFNRALGRALGLRFDNLLLSDRLERVPLSKVGNQAKLRFFAAMGHEPRVPLNAILGFSEIIRSKMFAPVDPSQHSSQHPSQHPRQQKDDVEGISESAARLLKMIDEIRMLSGIESGGVERAAQPAVGCREALRSRWRPASMKRVILSSSSRPSTERLHGKGPARQDCRPD
jgi:signal transduction histidine kinase